MTGARPDPDWDALLAQLDAVLEVCPDLVSALATTAALVHDASERFFWTGFYRPAEDGSGDLVVGPYQGPLACVRLAAGKGVCGAAARERRTVVVRDVHAFPGHIACSEKSRSEIVVPVPGGGDAPLVAVLDLDSDRPDAFDAADREGLERIAARLAAFARDGR